MKSRKSDAQEVAINLEGAVGFVSQNLLGKDFAELNAFLVEGVDVPREALEHDLVFKVSKQSAHGGRGQLFADDDGGRTTTLEILVQVVILLATGKGHDLGGHVGGEFLLAGAVLDNDVGVHLALAEANELQGMISVPWCRSW